MPRSLRRLLNELRRSLATRRVLAAGIDLIGLTPTPARAADTTPPVITNNQPATSGWVGPGASSAIYNVGFSDDVSLARAQYSAWTGPGMSGTSLIPWTDIPSTDYAASTGAWRVNFAALADGTTSYISLNAVDTAGNQRTLNDAFYILKDVSPPVVSISSPTNGATVTGSGPILLSLSDASGVTRTEYFVDGGISSVSGPPFFNAGLTTNSYANGPHTLRVRAFDRFSQISEQTINLQFNNDKTPPTLAITNPTAGAVLSGPVTLSADAVDNPGGVGVQLVRFSLGLATIGGDTSAPFTYPFNTTTVSNGAYTLFVETYDNNLNYSSATLNFQVFNTTAPANTAPVVNAGPDRAVILPATGLLSGSYTDDGLPSGSVTTTWTKVSGPALDTIGTPNALVSTVTFSTPGVYTYALTVNDGALSGQDTVVYTVSAPANAAPAVNAGPDLAVTLPNTGILRGSFTDDGLPSGSTPTAVWTMTSGPGPFSFSNPNVLTSTVTFFSTGTFNFALTVNDGQLSSQDTAVVTVVRGPDNTPPTGSITFPAANATVSGLVNVTAQASDNAGGAGMWYVSFAVDGNVLFTDTAPPYAYALDTFTLSNGTHTLTAQGADLNLNKASLSQLFRVANATAPVNRLPVAAADAYSMDEDTQLSVPVPGVLSNDTDPDGDSLTAAVVSGPTHGIMFFDPSGSILYNSAPDYFGPDAFTYRVSDGKGGVSTGTVTLTIRPVNDAPLVGAGPDQGITLPSVAHLQGFYSDDGGPAGSTAPAVVSWALVSAPSSVLVSNPNSLAPTATFSTAGIYVFSLTVNDGQLSAQDTVTVTVAGQAQTGLSTPALNRTVATAFGEAMNFLFTGSSPVQTGVTVSSLPLNGMSVIRGQAMGLDGAPLAGVQVMVTGHPEYGSTQTRADGAFDMAVKGGAALHVGYAKSGYLPLNRLANPRVGEFFVMPDAVMAALDPAVTRVYLSTMTAITVARGSLVTDQDGSRRGTLLFAPGTQATMTLAGGGSQPLPTLDMRITEYTVGPNGVLAMPDDQPDSFAYTYAAEYTADQAMAASATGIQFTQPVISYVENFLNFPVGSVVPSGYYEGTSNLWVASPNGRVVKVVGTGGGLADLDIDGNGIADSTAALTALGVSTAERQTLAMLYASGQSLWRTPVTHFSAWDFNWRTMLSNGMPPAPPPPPSPKGFNNGEEKSPCHSGSIIDCLNQSLGEDVSLTGTPLSLHYNSDRTTGRKYYLDVTLSTGTIPAELVEIALEVIAGGKKFNQSFPAQANLSTRFVWDGLDVYGRSWQGLQKADVSVDYVYRSFFEAASTADGSFLQPTGVPLTTRARAGIRMRQSAFSRSLGGWDNMGLGLGGWSLSAHHVYDPASGVVRLGDGSRIITKGTDKSGEIHLLAGNGTPDGGGDGGPAAAASLSPQAVAVSTGGVVYVADAAHHVVRRIGADGVITTVAGTGVFGSSGDGGPGALAQLWNPQGLAVGPDGSVYIAETGGHRVRRLSPNGVITTFAGTGLPGYTGDGGPASSARVWGPRGLAMGADGSLYIVDRLNKVVRKVTPAGIIQTVAGNNAFSQGGDGGPALQAGFTLPDRVAVAADGSFYVTESAKHTVRRIGTDGIITRFAGNGQAPGSFSGDGGSAVQAGLSQPMGVAVGPDNSVYIADGANNRMRRVWPGGVINTIAGTGTAGDAGDGGPGALAQLSGPQDVVMGADGTLLIADTGSNRVRRLMPQPASALTPEGHLIVSSPDGGALYEFDAQGRHLKTLDGATRATLLTFAYDGAGFLSSVSDANGNATAIERDGQGNATAIVAPLGQRTTLTTNGNKELSSIQNPAGETVSLTYNPGTLLSTLTDPKGNLHSFEYDTLGRLSRDTNPVGGFQTLTRLDNPGGYSVAVVNSDGKTNTYAVDNLPGGAQRRTNTAPDGTQTVETHDPSGATSGVTADGATVVQSESPDPRWGMNAPFTSRLSVTTPNGLVSVTTGTRAVTYANPADPLSWTQQTDTVSVNGSTYTSTYNNATRTAVTTTPQGRTRTDVLDAKGRTTQTSVPTLDAVNYTYDAKGRLSAMTQGVGTSQRTTSLAYLPNGFLDTVTDAAARTTRFTYDGAGRVLTQTLPDGRIIGYAYDANGNVTSVTPPSRPAHAFTYTATDLASQYAPPSVPGSGSNVTTYAYNLDKQPTLITRPDGQTITPTYDAAGRVSAITIPTGIYAYGYDLKGRLSGLAAPGGENLLYSYDGSLPLFTFWSGPVAGNVSQTYDNNFRVSTQSVNGANSVNFAYDADGLLTRAGAITLTRSAATGLLTGSALGLFTDAWTYNTFGEPLSYAVSAGGSVQYRVDSTRDKLGRLTQKVENLQGSVETIAYTYDTAGRLTQTTRNGAAQSAYTYDQNGNRLTATTSAGTTSGTYDNQDRLLTYGTTTYAYTQNGDLQSRTVGGQTTRFTYDALGNLRTANLSNGTTVQYVIDGENRRVGKQVNGTTTQGFLYNGQLQVIAELNGSGAITSRFVYGERANCPSYMVKGGVTYRIICDPRGSPRIVVNAASGALAQMMVYDEFGNVTQDTSPGFQPFGFAGGLYDRDTRLVRFGARDYDPQTGRWTAKDPIRFNGGDTNLYGYVVNDPINRFDPLGLLDFYVNAEVDLVGVFGVEFGGGLVYDVSKPIESGVFGTGGFAGGANVGVGVGGGFALREIEGYSTNYDVNLGKISAVVSFDEQGFNGLSISMGPGAGLAASHTNTKTFSIKGAIDWVRGLFGKRKGSC